MSAPNEKLAASLEALRLLQADGSRVFTSEQLTRLDRERLVQHGFLQEVMRGWLISASPSAQPGDTTPWYASFWEFCRRYCEDRFGDAWHLSPEQSLLLHAENTVIPKQVILYSPEANNNRIDLLFGTSFFALKQKQLPAARDLERKHGLQLFRVEPALLRVPEEFFAEQPVEAEVVLGALRDPSELLARLLDGGHAVIAGRLAGAFRRLGKVAIADEIIAAMQAADHVVREVDPFAGDRPLAAARPAAAPIVARLRTLWASARDAVLAELPPLGALRLRARTPEVALRRIDEVYQLDAYHSLSIEGYQVTPALVERVASGAWDPEDEDRETANALAARGYWLAFQRVRDAVRRLLGGGDLELLRTAHRDWYREMFSPHVSAGLLTPAMLAGYRNQPVFLRGSRHVPPRAELLREAMPALFDLIEAEPVPAVRAVLGHWLVGYVHPFPDGNGRIARFLMNAVLVAGGYPWTVIRVDDRAAYLAALETASVGGDVRPFARFVTGQMQRTPGAPKPEPKSVPKPKRAPKRASNARAAPARPRRRSR
ncbi:MAG TPA: Fic family protein [Kofleriaceae bacterium]|jgi:fido (protein-threonine AMPylation protein)|nr:Fic family protein [Kofleriaceae bacterium]